MSLLVDASPANPEEQFPFCRANICHALLGIDAEHLDDGSFKVRIESYRLGKVELALVTLPARQMYRASAEIVRTNEAAYCLQLINEGTAHISYRDEFSVSVGDIILFDTTSPNHIITPEDALTSTVVLLPKRLLEARLPPGIRIPQRLARNAGAVALLSNYLALLPQVAPSFSMEVGSRVGEILCDLTAAALFPKDEKSEQVGRGVRSARLAAAQRFINQNLTDSNLSPSMVGQHLGVTDRYVHKLFELTGKSFNENVIAARLDACRHALRMPAEDYRTIADIAFEYGFSDLSHFYRRYRAYWGETPGDTRKGHRSAA